MSMSHYGLAAPNLKFSSKILQRKDRLDGSRNMMCVQMSQEMLIG